MLQKARKMKGDEIKCPFNSTHWIRPKKMAKHLVKCKKNNPEKLKKMSVCVFSAIHYVESKDKEDHFLNCEARNNYSHSTLIDLFPPPKKNVGSEEIGVEWEERIDGFFACRRF